MLAEWRAVSTLDRMFDPVAGAMPGTATRSRSFQPAFDLRESDAELTIACDVPGVKREDLEVTLERGVLTLKGTRRFDSKPDEQVVLGRPYGTFSRAFTLPDTVDDANLTASVADGVLTVRIPKQPKARPKKIEVAGGPASKHFQG